MPTDLFLLLQDMFRQTLYLILITTILLSAVSCAVSKDPQATKFRLLQKGKLKDDTSFVYSLPYAINTKQRVVQGYFSRFTHKNRAAIDFMMKRGTAIHAARGGVVARVKEDGTKGGLTRSYRQYGNTIVINHNDGTRAGYWHLQFDGAVVNVGDTVQQGQLIGYSGKTGYTAFPHLHFIVWRSEAGFWKQIGTRFQTKRGIRYLRPYRRYKRIAISTDLP